MSTLSPRLPESLHRQIKELARREGVSISQFLATAAAEKISALATEEYLGERGARGRRAKFNAVLREVPRKQPTAGDEPAQSKPARRPSRRGR